MLRVPLYVVMIERKCTVTLLRKVGFYNFYFPKRKCYIKQKWACVFSVVFILSGRKIKKKLKNKFIPKSFKNPFLGIQKSTVWTFSFSATQLKVKKSHFPDVTLFCSLTGSEISWEEKRCPKMCMVEENAYSSDYPQLFLNIVFNA